MYFPVVHSGQYDLLALRDSAVDIRSSEKVVPVIIPVEKNPAGLRILLRRYTRSRQPFCLVINPICCKKTMGRQAIRSTILNDLLAENRAYYPTLMVDGSTTAAELISFGSAFPENEIALFHVDELATPEALNAANEIEPVFNLLETARRTYVRKFPAETRVSVEDPFRKQKNSEYPSDESFSETYREFQEDGYIGFGDYQTIGRAYAPGGTPVPSAVTLHLTYRSSDGAIRVRHFVSSPITARPEVPGRFLEAVAALLDWVDAQPDKLVYSQAIPEFRKLHEEKRFPALGVPKKLAIRHHLDLMLSLV